MGATVFIVHNESDIGRHVGEGGFRLLGSRNTGVGNQCMPDGGEGGWDDLI